jgi:hypothetical protein
MAHGSTSAPIKAPTRTRTTRRSARLDRRERARGSRRWSRWAASQSWCRTRIRWKASTPAARRSPSRGRRQEVRAGPGKPPMLPHRVGREGAGLQEDAQPQLGLPRRRWLAVPLACMARADPPAAALSRRPVHPHVPGERSHAVLGLPWAPGSFPRAWGTHTRRKEMRLRNRFIPRA